MTTTAKLLVLLASCLAPQHVAHLYLCQPRTRSSLAKFWQRPACSSPAPLPAPGQWCHAAAVNSVPQASQPGRVHPVSRAQHSAATAAVAPGAGPSHAAPCHPGQVPRHLTIIGKLPQGRRELFHILEEVGWERADAWRGKSRGKNKLPEQKQWWAELRETTKPHARACQLASYQWPGMHFLGLEGYEVLGISWG